MGTFKMAPDARLNWVSALFLMGCTSSELIVELEQAPLVEVDDPTPLPMPTEGVVLTKGLSRDACAVRFENCENSPNGLLFFPAYQSEMSALSDELQAKMIGKSWMEGCPVSLADLSLVRVLHWNDNGGVQWGEIIVANQEADNITEAFRVLYANAFPLRSIKPMYHYNGRDDASMAENNSSAFNCRKVKNSSRYSEHSYGTAIDINPLINPWVKGSRVDPPAGRDYVDRGQKLPGMITSDDIVVQTFAEKGWRWGGYWKSLKDYQHFSTSGK